jgi:hypothetical protein
MSDLMQYVDPNIFDDLSSEAFPPFAASAEEMSAPAFLMEEEPRSYTPTRPVPITNSLTPPDTMRTAFSMDSSDLFGRSPKLLNSSERGFNSALFNSDSLLPRLPQTSSSVTNASTAMRKSPNSLSASWSNTPANIPFGNDQNPPCNTLYVGNLPSDADEEELRTLFCSCPGYKRMSFRNRGNGPMCFVEVTL